MTDEPVIQEMPFDLAEIVDRPALASVEAIEDEATRARVRATFAKRTVVDVVRQVTAMEVPMPPIEIKVLKSPRGWVVVSRDGARVGSEAYELKKDAVEIAREVARVSQGRLDVYNVEGVVIEQRSYTPAGRSRARQRAHAGAAKQRS